MFILFFYRLYVLRGSLVFVIIWPTTFPELPLYKSVFSRYYSYKSTELNFSKWTTYIPPLLSRDDNQITWRQFSRLKPQRTSRINVCKVCDAFDDVLHYSTIVLIPKVIRVVSGQVLRLASHQLTSHQG